MRLLLLLSLTVLLASPSLASDESGKQIETIKKLNSQIADKFAHNDLEGAAPLYEQVIRLLEGQGKGYQTQLEATKKNYAALEAKLEERKRIDPNLVLEEVDDNHIERVDKREEYVQGFIRNKSNKMCKEAHLEFSYEEGFNKSTASDNVKNIPPGGRVPFSLRLFTGYDTICTYKLVRCTAEWD